MQQANIFFYQGFLSHTLTFTQAGRTGFTTSTHSQICRYLVYRNVYSLFLIELFVITKLIADEIYPHLGFVFNYIFINAIYSKF